MKVQLRGRTECLDRRYPFLEDVWSRSGAQKTLLSSHPETNQPPPEGKKQFRRGSNSCSILSLLLKWEDQKKFSERTCLPKGRKQEAQWGNVMIAASDAQNNGNVMLQFSFLGILNM